MTDDAEKLMLTVAWDGDPVATRELLSSGIDVNVRDNNGQTALMAAAMASDVRAMGWSIGSRSISHRKNMAWLLQGMTTTSK